MSLDVAKEISGKPPPRALSIEKCECPKEYEGTSCQNPNAGYFRYFPSPLEHNVTWIDLSIGKAKPCQCNGLSNTCDRETGFCHVRKFSPVTITNVKTFAFRTAQTTAGASVAKAAPKATSSTWT